MYSNYLRRIAAFVFCVTVSINVNAAQDGDTKLFVKFMECAQGFAPKLKSMYLKDREFGITVLLTVMIPDPKAISSHPQIPKVVKDTAFSIPTGERKRMLVEMMTSCDSIWRTTKPSSPILQQLMATSYSDQLQLINHINSESFQLIQIMQLKKANDVRYEPMMKSIMTPEFMSKLASSGLLNRIQQFTSDFQSTFQFIANDYKLNLK